MGYLVFLLVSLNAYAADFPIKGYPKEYDGFVASHITEAMLTQPASRMKKFCPAWPKMNRAARVKMYQDLVYGISFAESGLNRAAMYLEPQTHFVKPDVVTGKPVISEGLTQLSYQDGKFYAACNFDFKSDREYFLADYGLRGGKTSWNSTHLDRSILRPSSHLQCTVGIINSLLTSKKRAGIEFSDTLGAYWSVMRRSRDGYKRVWSKMRERKSVCL